MVLNERAVDPDEAQRGPEGPRGGPGGGELWRLRASSSWWFAEGHLCRLSSGVRSGFHLAVAPEARLTNDARLF